MSNYLAIEATRLMEHRPAGADLESCTTADVPGPDTCANGDGSDMAGAVENLDVLVALTSQRRRIDVELEDRLWSALVGGARVPDLVAITGLTQEQIREILRRTSAPSE